MGKKCKWKYAEAHSCWETGCGNVFVLIKGTPEDNDMKYCPYCGRPLWQLKGKSDGYAPKKYS